VGKPRTSENDSDSRKSDLERQLELLRSQAAASERALALLQIQRDLGLALAETQTLPEALETVLTACLQIEGIDCGGIYLVNLETGDMELKVHQGVPDKYLERFSHLEAGNELVEFVMQGNPVYGRKADASSQQQLDVYQTSGVNRLIAVPVMHYDQVLASLSLGAKAKHDIQQDAKHTLEAIASRLGGIIARMRAEEALRRQQGMLRRIIDLVPHHMHVKDYQGRTILANKAVAESYGYEVSDFEGSRHTDLAFIPNQEKHEASDDREVMDSGQPTFIAEEIRVDGNGKPQWFETTKVPFDFEGKQAVLVMAIDITERKIAAEALHQSEEKFSTAFRVSPVAITISNLEDGRLHEVNDAFLRFSGYSREEIIGQSAFDIALWADTDMRKSLVQALQQNSFVSKREVKLKTKDGEIRTVLWSGELMDMGWQTLIVSAFMDITDRIMAEDALRQSDETARALINAPFESMILVDTNLNILDLNDTAAKRMGIDKARSTGMTLTSALPDALAKFRKKQAQKIIALAAPYTWEDEQEGRHYSHRGYPIFDEYGRVVRLALFSTDITESRLTEQQLLAYQAQLRHLATELSLAESRERRRLADDLHDNIGQTLFMIKMKVDLCREWAPDQAALQALNEVSESIRQIITDLRALIVEMSPPTLSVLGLEAGLGTLAENIEREHGIQVRYQADSQTAPLSDDMKDLLYRASRELVINAVKHARPETISLAITHTPHQIRIDVEDDGMGFNPDDIGRVAEKHSGFGLFSIRERLDPIGGRLILDTSPGKGTRASLLAPLGPRLDIGQ
jgi:PAS domain S-box-containing protein